ncbi:MAG: type VI secretion system baseplate subunit TssF [Alphaproteobacteria bacterium]|nr:type VI secretion system baseplate subunit TssF [Alphaproteobacteria bacterium]
MSEELLTLYNRELEAIRRLAAEFAEAHPKVAGRLRVTADAIEDPHVERLIEAVAFLNARVHLRLEDDFPELTAGLLDTLYPHYLAPIPSFATVQFQAAPELEGSHDIPAGTELETEAVNGETCRFRTCHPVKLWPIAVDAVALAGRPLTAPPNPAAAGAAACLRISLKAMAPDKTIGSLNIRDLRFFLRGTTAHPLYELIFNHTLSVALAESPNDRNPIILDPACLKPVGFEAEEALLPYPKRTLSAYGLLTEYFAFPEKHLYFTLEGVDAARNAGSKLDLFLYFDKTFPELERSVTIDAVALGCSPMVNLFPLRAEPIAVDQTTSEYRIVADSRRPMSTEVHSILSVRSTDSAGKSRTVLPMYGLDHHGAERPRCYWFAARRPGTGRDKGTELFLTLVDADFNPAGPADEVLSLEVLCTNRNLTTVLPYGGGRPTLTLAGGGAAVKRIACLTPPTTPIRMTARGQYRWRLLSHLSLNHLSLCNGEEGAAALREILMLYDLRDSGETRAMLDGVLAVESRPAAARVASRHWGAVCQGNDVTVELDDSRFTGQGLFLFASVLERFLGAYTTINSFVRLAVRIRGRQGYLRKWPARSGNRHLL